MDLSTPIVPALSLETLPRFERAVVRWLGRFALEVRNVSLEDLRLAADAWGAFPQSPEAAMERLQSLCRAYRLA